MSKTLNKAIQILRTREKRGTSKYGRTLDNCKDSDYDWKMEIIEELSDALMYAAREIRKLEEILHLRGVAIEEMCRKEESRRQTKRR